MADFPEDMFFDALENVDDLFEIDYDEMLNFVTMIENASPDWIPDEKNDDDDETDLHYEDALDYVANMEQAIPVDEDGFEYEEIMDIVNNIEHSSQVFKCRKCALEFESHNEREIHELKGHVRRGVSESDEPSCSFYACDKCKFKFESKKERDIHEKNCRYLNSDKTRSTPFSSNSEPSSGSSGSRQFKCHRCNLSFGGRDNLIYHQMASYHFGAGNLQDFPWGEQQDPFVGMANGQEIKDIYMKNKSFILMPHWDEGNVKKVFNFPINEHVLDSDLESHLEYIYAQQKKSFKFNITVGVILEEMLDNGEVRMRYFKPALNVALFEDPLSVWNQWSLRQAIQALFELDINEKVQQFRPNSKYKVRFITQLQYIVYSSDQVLGAPVSLPDFIKRKKCIVTRTTDSRGRAYEENLCFFTALAQFRKKCEGHASYYNAIPESIQLLKQWHHYLRGQNLIEDISFGDFRTNFQGVDLEDFEHLEECFQTSINIFRLTSKNECEVEYLSSKKFSQEIHLNAFRDHINLIIDFKVYARKYVCGICRKILTSKQALKRHGTNCFWKTKYVFSGGYYKYTTSLFEDLEEVGVFVPHNLRHYPYFAVWDMEAMLEKIPDPGEGKLKYTHIHKPVSCSIASNVPGHEEAYCIVTENTRDLVGGMFEKFEAIWEKAIGLSYSRWGEYLDELKRMICEVELQSLANNRNSNQNNDNNSEEGAKLSAYECLWDQLKSLQVQFEGYMQQLIILSFNGSRYDTNLIRTCLSHYLHSNKEEGARKEIEITQEGIDGVEYTSTIPVNVLPMGDPKIIKKGKKYLMIGNSYYKFIDIINYLPPGTSYASFLKSFEIDEQKFYFPYEFLSSFQKLEQSFLPPYPSQDWVSSLKSRDLLNYEYEEWEKHGKNGVAPKTGNENYEMVKSTWEEKGWATMKDYLIYYNNCDTLPFVKAVNKLRLMYQYQGVDIFKQTISVPGVARIRLMAHAKEEGVLFSLFDTKNRDLYFMFRSQLVAGPSIIFTRYQEKNITPLNPDGDQICKSIYGYDVNSLYLYCIGGEMPTGDVVRRFADDDFTPRYNTRYSQMYTWLRYMEIKDGVQIRSLVTNGKECRIGRYHVDGLALLPNNKIRIYEFNGCYWHKHPCHLNDNGNERSEEDEKKYRETLQRESFFRESGFEVTTIWECDFNHLKSNEPLLHIQQNDFLSPFTQKNRKSVSEQDIIQGVMDGSLVGFLLVDIEVPPSLHDYYKDFPPLFANQDIKLTDVGTLTFIIRCFIFLLIQFVLINHTLIIIFNVFSGPHMAAHIQASDIKFKDRHLLVSDLRAKEILLATSLVRWYLQHGLQITKIHQVLEYVGKEPFKNFVREITEKRKEGARDPNKAVLAQTYKLIGNSSYGSMLMNQTKFDNTEIVSGEIEARQRVNSRFFKELDLMGGELYEVSEAPRKTGIKIPIHIGFQILQLAKQRMLEFAYDFVAKYIERPLYQYLYCDTDSLYMSLAKDSLVECVHPSKRNEYVSLLNGFCGPIRSCDAFLSRTCCETHNFEDDKEPGLLKVELDKGRLFLGLCSKTYVCETENNQVKLSCKGVNKGQLLGQGNIVEVFRKTLQDKKSRQGENGGIRQYKGQMYSYAQKKDAFTYLYIKRNVDDSGIYTTPLYITLDPVPCNLFSVTRIKQLTVEYNCTFKFGNRRFHSLMQAMVYFMILNGEKNAVKREEYLRQIRQKNVAELKLFHHEFSASSQWDEVKFCVVKDIVRHRLADDPEARTLLRESAPYALVYPGVWDSEWCAGEEWGVIRWIKEKDVPGKNYLGRIYSAIRDELMR